MVKPLEQHACNRPGEEGEGDLHLVSVLGLEPPPIASGCAAGYCSPSLPGELHCHACQPIPATVTSTIRHDSPVDSITATLQAMNIYGNLWTQHWPLSLWIGPYNDMLSKQAVSMVAQPHGALVLFLYIKVLL